MNNKLNTTMKFEVESNKLVLSDPYYNLDDVGAIVNAKNGTWFVDVTYTDKKVIKSMIAICLEDYENEENFMEKYKNDFKKIKGYFCVDSGQFGFFDLKSYRNDADAKDLEKAWENYNTEDGEECYNAMCYLTDNNFGVYKNGCVSVSGFGDGVYTAHGIKKIKTLLQLKLLL